jgi:hypothetical protein
MPPKVHKKRGRKPSKKTPVDANAPPKVRKKRGRKPKGGKIIKNINEKVNPVEIKQANIILQLKCSAKDIETDAIKNPDKEDIESFNIVKPKQTNIEYEQYDNITYNIPKNKQCTYKEDGEKINIKMIWEKLEILKLKLHLNEVSDKRSNCFYCTCPFDNPPVYIPRQERNNIIEVYGCFCSPECATAYLKNESIDCSTLWERYALLNNIYGKIYNYDKNIKPSPNPFYTLDKYYGNLSIQEYRKLLSKDRLLLVVEKPLTKMLPELYEENNEYPNIFNNILHAKVKKGPQYRLKRNKPINTKSHSLNNNFGLN